MRRKAKPKKARTTRAEPTKALVRGARRHANVSISRAKGNANLVRVRQTGRPTTVPTGRGLGKAGAKRLGRLLKRAIQPQEEEPGRGKLALPKTPVRLFKHQVQSKAENGHRANSVKPASARVSQLILTVVSQCKHRGVITMAELKQTLMAGGYDVTKNNRRVNVVTKRLVNDETLVRTTRNVTYRVNNKMQAERKQVRITRVKPLKPKEDLKQSRAANKTPKAVEKSATEARKIPRPTGKSTKQEVKTRRAASRSHKHRGKTRRSAARTLKPRRKTPKAGTQPSNLVGKKHRSRTVKRRKASTRVRRTGRGRPKQNSRFRSYRKRQMHKTRPRKTRSRGKTQQVRRRSYYY